MWGGPKLLIGHVITRSSTFSSQLIVECNLSWSFTIDSESCCEWIATKSDGHFPYIWANRPQTTFQNCRKFQILFCLIENNLEESFLSSFFFQTQHHHNQTQNKDYQKSPIWRTYWLEMSSLVVSRKEYMVVFFHIFFIDT